MGCILHFGLGNFARAHLLDYTQDAGGWEVIGVSLRSAAIRDGMKAQDYDYSLCIQNDRIKKITVLQDVLVAPEDPVQVLKQMQKADIISVTVTEKGYHLDASGVLDLEDPAIEHDLAGQGPTTLIGFLAHGLAQCTQPVTVLSCDNRVENGTALKAAVGRFADQAGLSINWDQVRFPNAMVDRITPATTDALRQSSGDPMAVPTEGFREWVIEDDFAGSRPDWPDVQFVKDVAPHELRKLRMLNGAHSLMAYEGLARGHTFVHEAIADTTLRDLVQALMMQAGATLPSSVQGQVQDYVQALIARFENPALAHRLDQIAMDGSQKVSYRFVGTLRDGPSDAAVIGLLAWMKYCQTQTAKGNHLNDPKAAEIADAVASPDPKQELLKLIDAVDLLSLIRG